jgi:hypothetical protein
VRWVTLVSALLASVIWYVYALLMRSLSLGPGWNVTTPWRDLYHSAGLRVSVRSRSFGTNLKVSEVR